MRFFFKESADMEWKYARTQLYMHYIEEGSVLPSPFNLIPSPYYIVEQLRKLWSWSRNRDEYEYQLRTVKIENIYVKKWFHTYMLVYKSTFNTGLCNR